MNEEAISRYKRNAEAREDAQRKRSHANFKSLVVGMLVLAAAALGYAYLEGGLEDLSSLEGLRNLMSSAMPKKYENPYIEGYSRVAAEFAKGELAYWKNAPKELRPKNAPAGTVYYALVPRERGFDLYQLKGGGAVDEITPFGKPVPMTFADFKKSCDGKPYFIACAGRVFVGGGGDLKTMDELRKGLLPR